jgi:hypothetical protein
MRVLRWIGRSRPDDLARYRPWLPDDPTLDAPPQADWAWRPGLWREPLSPAERLARKRRSVLKVGAVLHHDAAAGSLRLIQRAGDGATGAPFALSLEPVGLQAGFVSLALDLPDAACRGMATHQMLVATARGDLAGIAAWLRINLVRAATTDSRTVALHPAGDVYRGAIDLYGMPQEVMPPDRIWVDLIIDPPPHRIAIADLQLARVPRPPF